MIPKLEGLPEPPPVRHRGSALTFSDQGRAEAPQVDDAVVAGDKRDLQKAVRRREAASLTVSSAIPSEVREKMLATQGPEAPDFETLKGTRGPHLWNRGDPFVERKKALARSRKDRCGGR